LRVEHEAPAAINKVRTGIELFQTRADVEGRLTRFRRTHLRID